MNSEAPNYDCVSTTSYVTVQTVGVHYSRLLRYDPQNYPAVIPDAAKSWSISPDGLVYTFKLRANVKFHDGSTLISEDVKASFDRAASRPPAWSRCARRGSRTSTRSRRPIRSPSCSGFSTPNASMASVIASPANCIYSAAKLKQDINWPIRNVMGTGPYRFKEHVQGSHWVGERFDGYFLPGRPLLDGFRVQFMSGAAMINALQSGEIHAEFRTVTPAQRDKLKEVLGDRIAIAESPWVCKMDSGSTRRVRPSTTCACAARCRWRSTAAPARRRWRACRR